MTGPEFRAELDRLGLSQTDFARLTGKPPETVNRWCRGVHPVDPLAGAWLRLYAILTSGQRAAMAEG
jgi:DNA-binding transcriptional regulator YiaG